MKICFLGNTHLTFCASVAAARRGFIPLPLTEIGGADLIFFSEDTDTKPDGNRLLSNINFWMYHLPTGKPVILQSQVPPGFCRFLKMENLFHQPETLRIEDATERAYAPEFIAVGSADPDTELPEAYLTYLKAFNCPILRMTYEDAEFSKIAINMMLASQVDTTNRLALAASKCGADWDHVAEALRLDSRIGKYLTPGRWQDSIHLLRDYVTLKEIEDAR